MASTTYLNLPGAREISEDYISDASGFRGSTEAAFAPEDEAGVMAVLAEATSRNIPVTLLGAGSGLTGARVAEGGWVLSLENFRKLEIRSGSARVGAAVRLVELGNAAQQTRQFYAPDPTENTASVGGTISTNASGSRSFRFGSTRQHILALKVALMNGRVVEYRRGDRIDFDVMNVPPPNTRKYTTGYPLRTGMDWIDLFCGAEGTLGVVLDAEVRLLPMPQSLFAAVVFFPGDDEAVNAVDAWRAVDGLRMIEYFDRASLTLLRSKYPEIPKDCGAALLIESEGEDIEGWEKRLVEASALIEACWFATSPSDRERFRKFRHALPELVNATMAGRGFLKMGSDYSVPLAANREMLLYYRTRLDAELPGHYVIYGHIGDAHVHVNMLPASDDGFRRAGSLMDDFAAKAAELGGAVSAEHGLGKRKAKYLRLQYPPEYIDAMMAVKRRLDPSWLLGRGTLFPYPN